MSTTPVLGVSACLLGDEVRFDGRHKRYNWLTEELGQFVQFVRSCPEMAMGLGVPRESMRLVRPDRGSPPRLVSNVNQVDLTDLARDTSRVLVETLPEDVNGYVFKNRSPSCGLVRVKVYDWNGSPFSDGVGFFAKEFVRRHPDVPVIEEGMLTDTGLREQFVTQVFAHHRISNLEKSIFAIQALHQAYKFVIHAHHEPSLRKLGRIAANSNRRKPAEVYDEYKKEFLAALRHPTTLSKRINVIQHIYGFIKKKVNEKEKSSALRAIEKYREERIPFVAIMTLLQHLVEKHGSPYIENQKFFSPWPEALRMD